MKVYDVVPLTKTSRRDSVFSYLSPSGKLAVGDLVEIEFSRRVIPAIVLGQGQTTGKLKPISKILKQGFINQNAIELAKFLSKTYYCSLAQSFLAMLGKDFSDLEKLPAGKRNITDGKIYHLSACPENRLAKYLEVVTRITDGQILILFPSEKRLDRFAKQLIEAKIKYTNLSGAKIDWQAIQTDGIFLGLRHSVLRPFNNLATVIIDDFISSSYQELRVPIYNVPEIAIFRQSIEKFNLIFGGSGSFAKLEELKHSHAVVNIKSERPAVKTVIYQTPKNDIFNWEITEQLSRGRWLIFTNAKGEGSIAWCRVCQTAIRCKNCRVPIKPNDIRCKNCKADTQTTSCDQCGSINFATLGWTTQQVKKKLIELGNTDCEIIEGDIAHQPEARIIISTVKIFDFEIDFDNALIVDPYKLLYTGGFQAQEKALSLIERLKCQTKNNIFIPSAGLENSTLSFLTGSSLAWENILAERKEHGLPPYGQIVEIKILDKIPEIKKELELIKLPNVEHSGLMTVMLKTPEETIAFDKLITQYYSKIKVKQIKNGTI